MNILFYGGHYWDRGAWFRKQQFASRLAKRGHVIFYIEDSLSIIRKTKKDKNRYFTTRFKKVDENLYVITPSCYFPFPNNYYSCLFSNIKLIIEIKIFFVIHGINDFILWYNKVSFSNILFLFRKRITIFDLCDDFPYYSKLFNDETGYETNMRYLENAFDYSSVAIASALRIKEKYQYLSKNEIIVIPNGHNLPIANVTVTPHKELEDLRLIRKPIIGFLGTLFKFIDDDLLECIIRERPEYNYVFVGKIQADFPIEKIKSFENTFLLGEKKKDDIFSYIAEFDVCINPFRKHEVNDSVSPVKVFEYLAMKKPVVSTYMYSLQKEEIARYIFFAKDKEEFLEMIDKAIKDKLTIKVSEEVLFSYSWDSLFDTLLKLLNSEFESNISILSNKPSHASIPQKL